MFSDAVADVVKLMQNLSSLNNYKSIKDLVKAKFDLNGRIVRGRKQIYKLKQPV